MVSIRRISIGSNSKMLQVARLLLACKHTWTTTVMAASRLRRRVIVWVFCVSFDMLLEILGSLEGFLTEITFVWLQWNMHTDVRSDMITLHSSCPAVSPGASQVEVIRRLATNMALANMILEEMLVFYVLWPV
jgi:hypothetical protein